jgi:hypothetical protein
MMRAFGTGNAVKAGANKSLRKRSIEAIIDSSECAQSVEVDTVLYDQDGSRHSRSYRGSARAHPSFELYFDKAGVSLIDTDLAVIVLEAPINDSPVYKLAWDELPHGQEVVMIGYGPGDTHPLYGQRHLVENKVTGFTKSESGDIRLVIEALLTPDGSSTAVTTRGDSGGGCVSKADPTRLLGISSISTTTNRGRKASVFTSVKPHRDWLKKQLDNH